MPARVEIDNRVYQTHFNPVTGRWFIANVTDDSDAGRLYPDGRIRWFDGYRHQGGTSRIRVMAAAPRTSRS